MRTKLSFRRPRLRQRGVSVRSKLTIILITVTLSALFIIGYLSWQSSRTALNNAIFNELTTVRTLKAAQVERYFAIMRSHLQTLTEDESIIAAMVRFNKAFRELDREHIPPLWDIRLETHYENEFFPRLAENISGTPEFDNYRPRGQAATYLQYHYLVTNTEPTGAKGALDFARDESTYSTYHADYHPWLRDLTEEFDYYDLFLIDFETGDIVYSVEKEVDFATNLVTGPYQRSGLAQVVQQVQANPARHALQVVDFQFYQPSYNVPAAFIAGPIYNGPHVIGILALQFPLNELDNIMTGGERWQAEGLGETGEAYLVGTDLLRRSQSRALVEDPEAYRAALTSAGMSPAQADIILRQGTPILRQSMQNAATTAAVSGTIGTQSIIDYRGERILTAYTPLRLEGLSWALIAQIDAEEAFAPITELTRNLVIATAILVAVIAFLAVILASTFMHPMMRLIAGTQQLNAGRAQEGKAEIELLTKSRDEFGELARTFDELHESMRTQLNQLEAQNREYLALLFSNLPTSVVERFRGGERRIIEQVARATVLFVRLSDYGDLMTNAEAEETALLINELDDAFYEAAERHDLVLFKLIGQQYVAACGLVSQRLDHARRTVDLAMSMRNIVNNFNLTNESSLTFHAGIDTGSIIGGIIGHHTFAYDLWGNAVRVAQETNNHATANEILVTQDVYQQVQTLYTFTAMGLTVHQFGEELAVWRLEQSADDRLPSVSIATAEEEPDLEETISTVEDEGSLLDEVADHD